jgi:predicted nicotinamide N-methyase
VSTYEAEIVEALCFAGGQEWNLLRVKDQDALIARVQTEEDLETFPYGLMLWASALALADAVPAGAGRLLELGAGVGLAGLAARAKGWDVVQTDYDERALALCRTNAARNGIEGVEIRTGDWRTWPDELIHGFDLVVGADILYERTLHPVLRELLPRFGCPVLVADPLRPQAADFIATFPEAQKAMHRVDWEEDAREIALFSLFSEGKPGGQA